jgi:hypothetical protein
MSWELIGLVKEYHSNSNTNQAWYKGGMAHIYFELLVW